MRSLLSLLNHWFCCKFTFLVFVIFTKKWIRVRGAKREDFHKIVSNLPAAGFFFVQSWQIIFGSPFKNRVFVVLCVNFVTLSILLSSIVLYLSKNIVPFIFEVRFRLSRLDFFGIFFAKAKSGDYFFFILVHKICWTAAQGGSRRVLVDCVKKFHDIWIIRLQNFLKSKLKKKSHWMEKLKSL